MIVIGGIGCRAKLDWVKGPGVLRYPDPSCRSWIVGSVREAARCGMLFPDGIYDDFDVIGRLACSGGYPLLVRSQFILASHCSVSAWF
jgi:hypothetical protein